MGFFFEDRTYKFEDKLKEEEEQQQQQQERMLKQRERMLKEQSPTNTAETEQSPLEFREMVRRRTCYSTLRNLIDVFAVLSFISLIILGLMYIVIGAKANPSFVPVIFIIGGVMGVLGYFIIITWKQGSLLLVDIADTLIEQNRKKNKSNPES